MLKTRRRSMIEYVAVVRILHRFTVTCSNHHAEARALLSRHAGFNDPQHYRLKTTKKLSSGVVKMWGLRFEPERKKF
jgi:transketolase C-terminal domain/subunit